MLFLSLFLILLCQLELQKSVLKLGGHFEIIYLPFVDFEKPFKCIQCERRYKYKTSLMTHKRYGCGSSPKFRCSKCGRAFALKQSLQRHFYRTRDCKGSSTA